MAAPRSRRLRNQTAPVVHTRQEISIAVIGSAAIVAVTLILIWAMRPGDPNSFTEGKGGLIHRQPKVSLWLLATLAALGLAAWVVLRHDSKIRKQTQALALSIGGILVVAFAVFGVWHNSLVHDYAVPTTVPPTTIPAITTTVPQAATTTRPGATTTPTTVTTPTTTPSVTTTPSATTTPAPSTTGG